MIEVLRSVGYLGLPVGLAGYALTEILPLAQIASVFGVYGLSFFVIFVNGLVCFALQRHIALKSKVFWLFFGVVLLLSLTFWGQNHLREPQSQNVLKISIIQPNISPKEKWNLSRIEKNISIHEKFSKKVLLDRPDLIVWPETAVTCFLFHEKRKDILSRIETFVKKINVPLLIGSEDFNLKGGIKHAYNVAALITPEQGFVKKYAKIKLVPFVEKAPARFLIPFLRECGLPAIFESGREPTVFEVRKVAISAVICFEGLFSSLVNEFIRKGAQIIINITNDAPSLGKMKFYYKINMQMLKIRAIENRRSYVRVANDGISATIDPYGRIGDFIEPFEQGVLTVSVPVNQDFSFYSQNPHLMFSFSLLLFFLGLAFHGYSLFRIYNK